MEIVQSFIYSVARVKLSLYEQRILLKVIEHAQVVLKGKLIKNMLFRMQHDLDNVKIELPVRYVLSDHSSHYEQVKEAARSLMSRKFEFWDTETKACIAHLLSTMSRISKEAVYCHFMCQRCYLM